MAGRLVIEQITEKRFAPAQQFNANDVLKAPAKVLTGNGPFFISCQGGINDIYLLVPDSVFALERELVDNKKFKDVLYAGLRRTRGRLPLTLPFEMIGSKVSAGRSSYHCMCTAKI